MIVEKKVWAASGVTSVPRGSFRISVVKGISGISVLYMEVVAADKWVSLGSSQRGNYKMKIKTWWVGDDGVEPSASFLSGKRSTAEPVAHKAWNIF